jgi:hypothetical protein
MLLNGITDNGINSLMESDLSRLKSSKLLCHALRRLKLIHLLLSFRYRDQLSSGPKWFHLVAPTVIMKYNLIYLFIFFKKRSLGKNSNFKMNSSQVFPSFPDWSLNDWISNQIMPLCFFVSLSLCLFVSLSLCLLVCLYLFLFSFLQSCVLVVCVSICPFCTFISYSVYRSFYFVFRSVFVSSSTITSKQSFYIQCSSHNCIFYEKKKSNFFAKKCSSNLFNRNTIFVIFLKLA